MNPSTKADNRNRPKDLQFYSFSESENPILEKLGTSTQTQYLTRYLLGLNCTSILIEQNYFDRDYLAEFSEFYSTSARGYNNVCERWHFFSKKIDRDDFIKFLENGNSELDKLNSNYLGFSIIRPIPMALGRTVLKWYDDHSPKYPRVKATRIYKVNIVGIQLEVKGLAWQQQDTGVSACATIALWSAIHSAAFDEFYSIPTTAELTKLAHSSACTGTPIFPSSGLTMLQILEAIKQLKFFPGLETGDLPNSLFSRERFGLLCSMFIRSGFPIILTGRRENSSTGHAVCLTGFRESQPNLPDPGKASVENEKIAAVYIHDDNLGPNVRFKVEDKIAGTKDNEFSYITIKSEAPPDSPYVNDHIEDPTKNAASFIPTAMIVAMPSEIRLSPKVLRERSDDLINIIVRLYNELFGEKVPVGFFYDISYFVLPDYLMNILPSTLEGASSSLLAKVQLNLCEKVPPMSKYIGVVRLKYKSEPVLDLLFDTSDSAANFSAFASVSYHTQFSILIQACVANRKSLSQYFGVLIDAFE